MNTLKKKLNTSLVDTVVKGYAATPLQDQLDENNISHMMFPKRGCYFFRIECEISTTDDMSYVDPSFEIAYYNNNFGTHDNEFLGLGLVFYSNGTLCEECFFKDVYGVEYMPLKGVSDEHLNIFDFYVSISNGIFREILVDVNGCMNDLISGVNFLNLHHSNDQRFEYTPGMASWPYFKSKSILSVPTEWPPCLLNLPHK